jgi:eukaryotic-like serine/threonine-protein kinase
MELKKGIIRFFTSKTAKKVYIAISATILLFLLFNDVIMPWFVNRGGTREVPDVEGLSYENAWRLLDSLGFDPRQGDIRPDPRRSAGLVITQNPPAGSFVKFGRRIYLTVSGGEPLVVVPDLKGHSLREAKFSLTRNGLNLGEVEYQVSTEFPENTAMAQSLAAGTTAKKGNSIRVTMSLGDGTGKVTVPELVGKSVQESQKLLAQKGLKVGNITYQVNPELVPNTILTQFPHPGDQVAMGQAIDIFVVQPGGKKLQEIKE